MPKARVSDNLDPAHLKNYGVSGEVCDGTGAERWSRDRCGPFATSKHDRFSKLRQIDDIVKTATSGWRRWR
jgi:hypothetical protein